MLRINVPSFDDVDRFAVITVESDLRLLNANDLNRRRAALLLNLGSSNRSSGRLIHDSDHRRSGGLIRGSGHSCSSSSSSSSSSVAFRLRLQATCVSLDQRKQGRADIENERTFFR